MDNVRHRPGGGDKKIFDDKEYLKQIDHAIQPTTPPAQVMFRRFIEVKLLLFFCGNYAGKLFSLELNYFWYSVG
jgi:hypothetical protein